MENEPALKPSFSLRQRWGIFFSVLVSIAAMLSVLVMLNYLGARYYLRFPWSIETRHELAPQTISLLKAVTNDINVIIYYNKNDLLYEKIRDLLDEYRLRNPRISIRTVNYLADPADAAKVKESFNDFMDPLIDTNAVIFSSAGGTNVVSGDKLGDYVIEPMAGEGEQREFRNKLTHFRGEEAFNEAILRVLFNRPIHAYFLEGPGAVHRLNSQDFRDYQKFKILLQKFNIDINSLSSLRGTNGIPADCRLLVIAGPGVLGREEVENVSRYLDHGGRLFVLFNYLSRDYNTQLEPLLAKWGIAVGQHYTVRDLENYYGDSGNDIVVKTFNKFHPAVSHLQGFNLELALPRAIGTNSNNQGPDTATAQELAWTGKKAVTNESLITTGKPVPLMAAVEKGDVKGITDQGTTRIIVVGDSLFLDNEMITAVPQNRAFAGYAVNWLVGQTPLLQGVGPQAVREYQLKLTPPEAQSLRWILLGAMPGAILLFGGLVWLRRRR